MDAGREQSFLISRSWSHAKQGLNFWSEVARQGLAGQACSVHTSSILWTCLVMQCIVSLSASNLVSRSFSSPCSSGNSCGSSASVANIPMWWGLQIPMRSSRKHKSRGEQECLNDAWIERIGSWTIWRPFPRKSFLHKDRHVPGKHRQPFCLIQLTISLSALGIMFPVSCPVILLPNLPDDLIFCPKPASEACLNSGSAGY